MRGECDTIEASTNYCSTCVWDKSAWRCKEDQKEHM